MIIAAVGAVISEVAAGEPVELIGITAQGDGLWLLDADGRQVRPPILWSDARAAAVVTGWMESGLAERAFRRSGNMLFPGAAAPLLAFLQEEEPASLTAASTAGYCKDAIVQRLTGARATDVSDASLPFLDPRRRQYDDDLLALYGVSAWGLASRMGVSREDGQAIIARYFERFPGIRAYMDDTLNFVRENGYTQTLFGRKTHFYPNIRSPNPSIRGGAERAAINAPIQGTSADLIKRAMARMDGARPHAPAGA